MRALFDIAFYNEGQPTQVRDIAERQSIPQRFLEQIFQDLKRSGIVDSKRGPQGGYLLARPAAEIPLGEVIEIIEGPVALGDASASAKARAAASSTDSQEAADSVFSDLSLCITECLNAVTVQDVCERADQLGVRRPGSEGYVYSI